MPQERVTGGIGRRGLDKARETLEAALYGTALYRVSLRGKRPEALAFGPVDPWSGDAVRGAALLAGDYRFAGVTVSAVTAPPWRPEGASRRWLEALHGFDWLRDLEMLNSAEARRLGRQLAADWIEHCGEWDELTWRPDVLGRRLVAWLSHSGLLLAEADRAGAEALLGSLGEQARHLSRVAASGPDGAARLGAIKGLLFAALCLPGDDARLAQGLRLLEHELERQILADGGHVSRSPQVQLDVFGDLVELRGLLAAARKPACEALRTAIDRMAPMLRFFRHGDGGLALFNGSCEQDPALIDRALALGEAGGKAPSSAPHSGFERLRAYRTLIITDVGAPTALSAACAHGGTLSFEMSVEGQRMIVNCGAHGGGDDGWHDAMRATAAHSTAVIDDCNMLEHLEDGALGRRPKRVVRNRLEDGGNIWIDASHDGYRELFGLTHRRRLYLSAEGDSLRGEDILSGIGEAQRFTIRFHLHPNVKASLTADGTGALLRLPSGVGWRMHSAGAALVIADSVYLGDGGKSSRCEQIVLSGPIKSGANTVKWALSRVTAKD